MTEKVCTKCGIKKEVTLFHKDKLNEDGRTFQCTECRRRKGKDNRVGIKFITALHAALITMGLSQIEFLKSGSPKWKKS